MIFSLYIFRTFISTSLLLAKKLLFFRENLKDSCLKLLVVSYLVTAKRDSVLSILYFVCFCEWNVPTFFLNNYLNNNRWENIIYDYIVNLQMGFNTHNYDIIDYSIYRNSMLRI